MPLSVRLDKETEELLQKAAKRLGMTKSEVVKGSILTKAILIITYAITKTSKHIEQSQVSLSGCFHPDYELFL